MGTVPGAVLEEEAWEVLLVATSDRKENEVNSWRESFCFVRIFWEGYEENMVKFKKEKKTHFL
jgi:hypothetical protein